MDTELENHWKNCEVVESLICLEICDKEVTALQETQAKKKKCVVAL